MLKKESIRLKLRENYIEFTADIRARKLIDENFTIISNNCWAGLIYQSYNQSYKTPTVGLFFMAEDYIKFIYNIKYYFSQKITFISADDSKWEAERKNNSNWGTYPIGRLDDIEIHFLHYHSQEEAAEKWYRRIERINWNRILYKFNDQNGCTEKELNMFAEFKQLNKICFTSKQCTNISNAIYIENSKKYSEIPASYEPFGMSKYINITQLLNEMKEVK